MSQPAERTPSDPFPAQALHVCQVLARMLQRVPRPESVQLFTADHWSSPWLQVHLYPDPDDAQLAAYQQAFGGRLTRNRRESEDRSVVYSELATVVDRVRLQVWNVNESPMPTPRPEGPKDIAQSAESVKSVKTVEAVAAADAGEPVDAS
jgi:hypothetical protein